MADYWVSREKHYCKYCNCWVQGDKASVKNHENGNRHKFALQNFFKNKRNEKKFISINQNQLQQQLNQIEKDAQAQFQRDIQGIHSYADPTTAASPLPSIEPYSAQDVPPPPPRPSSSVTSLVPPPPPRINKYAPSAPNSLDHALASSSSTPPLLPSPSQSFSSSNLAPSSNAEIEKLLVESNENSTGVYTVKGVTYLEGKYHEDKLGVGCNCETWVDELDKWMESSIVSVQETAIPNTELIIKKIKVSLLDAVDFQSRSLDVSSERIRIRIPHGKESDYVIQRLRNGENDNRMNDDKSKSQNLDESTGFGKWSTVIIRTVDQSQVNKEQDGEENKMTSNENTSFFEEEAGDDALSAFNPFGGKYKGFQVDDNISGTAFSQTATGRELTSETVSFKKRKKVEKNKKNIKRFRDTLE